MSMRQRSCSCRPTAPRLGVPPRHHMRQLEHVACTAVILHGCQFTGAGCAAHHPPFR